jgi:hypothetical protein
MGILIQMLPYHKFSTNFMREKIALDIAAMIGKSLSYCVATHVKE